MASGLHFLGSLRTSDVIYCPMPLYHSAGGCVTMGQSFIFGCTVAIRAKFSASSYFPDCIKYNATVTDFKVYFCLRCSFIQLFLIYWRFYDDAMLPDLRQHGRYSDSRLYPTEVPTSSYFLPATVGPWREEFTLICSVVDTIMLYVGVFTVIRIFSLMWDSPSSSAGFNYNQSNRSYLIIQARFF